MADPFYLSTALALNFDEPEGSSESLSVGWVPRLVTGTGQGLGLVSHADKVSGVGSLRCGPATSGIIRQTSRLIADEPFTAECWFQSVNGAVTNGTIFSQNAGNGATGSLTVFVQSGATLRFALTTSPGVTQTISHQNAVIVGVWHHVALVKSNSGVYTLFLDGVPSSTTLTNSVTVLNTNFYIGSVSVFSYFDGYIDLLRVNVGEVRYTTAFTPSTEPFENERLTTYSATAIGTGTLMPLNQTTTLPNQPVVFRFDPQLGTATLTGTVKNIGSPNQPVARRVILIEEQSGRVIRETFSNATTGVYTFSELLPQARYTVIAYDHTGVFSAVIADNLEATL